MKPYIILYDNINNNNRYYAAQDVLEGTASISRHKSLASLTSVAEIRELLGFLCGKLSLILSFQPSTLTSVLLSVNGAIVNVPAYQSTTNIMFTVVLYWVLRPSASDTRFVCFSSSTLYR